MLGLVFALPTKKDGDELISHIIVWYEGKKIIILNVKK